MSKKTYIFGDCHGAGYELQGLLDRIAPSSDDEIISIGDLFDRGLAADIAWQLMQGRQVFMGNHEYKMWQWMRGEFNFLPGYYYVALNKIIESGVSPDAFFDWLALRPWLEDRGSYMITHAGVVLDNVLRPNLSMNVYYADGRNCFDADCGYVYGKGKGQVMSRPEFNRSYWWDIYKGEKLVIYGHLVTGDNLPRIRYGDSGLVNSIGLDTAAVHGGNLTCYCPEEDKFYSYQSGIDWGKKCEEMIKGKPPLINPDLMSFVKGKREELKAQSGTGTVQTIAVVGV